ncbi:14754_t:CDS:10 [Acaulospora morrowiae]|uniref:14754_t:CDS:1 n=1 Tax=Acaulospora morrowiae TaxID=94023 RepID=A0A9N9CBB5_9GLOM|nr:14754_t:CDS:10 [Acaulospora morrowiae]
MVRVKQELISTFSIDYWDRDPNLWGDVVDWDIYFAKKMPSCTSRDSHMALSVELDSILKKISTDNFAYKKASVLRAALKVKYFSVTNSWQKDMCYAPRLRSTAHQPDMHVSLCWEYLTTPCDCGRATLSRKATCGLLEMGSPLNTLQFYRHLSTFASLILCPIQNGGGKIDKFWKKHVNNIKKIGLDNRIIKERIINVAMHAAEEEFTKEYSRNSKHESSALDDEEYQSSNDEEISLVQVEHDVLGICEETMNNKMKEVKKSGSSTTRAKRKDRYEKPGTQEESAEVSASKRSRQEQRYAGMDQSRFWVLRSGRSVEEILQRACLQEDATVMIRSFTIDFSCAVTENLFSEDEWEEIMEKNVFELPELPPSTISFLLRMKKALVKRDPACQVPLPDIDKFACTLVQDSCKIWYNDHDMFAAQRLYSKTPSLFSMNDLSEAFWAHNSWPLLTELLDDMDNLCMIDREKSGIESGKRRNSDRKYHSDTQTPKKRVGRKVDLVVRDVVQKKDYMIVERMKDWDEYSTKFLKETSVDLFRETHTIMMHRLQDTGNEELWDKGRFFGIHTGSRGFQTFELRPAGGLSYVSLFHGYPIYQLPTSIQDMKPQIQGLVHILQVRQLMSDTITLDRRHPRMRGDGKQEDSNWYGSTYTRLDASINLVSSPLGPE